MNPSIGFTSTASHLGSSLGNKLRPPKGAGDRSQTTLQNKPEPEFDNVITQWKIIRLPETENMQQALAGETKAIPIQSLTTDLSTTSNWFTFGVLFEIGQIRVVQGGEKTRTLYFYNMKSHILTVNAYRPETWRNLEMGRIYLISGVGVKQSGGEGGRNIVSASFSTPVPTSTVGSVTMHNKYPGYFQPPVYFNANLPDSFLLYAEIVDFSRCAVITKSDKLCGNPLNSSRSQNACPTHNREALLQIKQRRASISSHNSDSVSGLFAPGGIIDRQNQLQNQLARKGSLTDKARFGISGLSGTIGQESTIPTAVAAAAAAAARPKSRLLAPPEDSMLASVMGPRMTHQSGSKQSLHGMRNTLISGLHSKSLVTSSTRLFPSSIAETRDPFEASTLSKPSFVEDKFFEKSSIKNSRQNPVKSSAKNSSYSKREEAISENIDGVDNDSDDTGSDMDELVYGIKLSGGAYGTSKPNVDARSIHITNNKDILKNVKSVKDEKNTKNVVNKSTNDIKDLTTSKATVIQKAHHSGALPGTTASPFALTSSSLLGNKNDKSEFYRVGFGAFESKENLEFISQAKAKLAEKQAQEEREKAHALMLTQPQALDQKYTQEQDEKQTVQVTEITEVSAEPSQHIQDILEVDMLDDPQLDQPLRGLSAFERRQQRILHDTLSIPRVNTAFNKLHTSDCAPSSVSSSLVDDDAVLPSQRPSKRQKSDEVVNVSSLANNIMGIPLNTASTIKVKDDMKSTYSSGSTATSVSTTQESSANGQVSSSTFFTVPTKGSATLASVSTSTPTYASNTTPISTHASNSIYSTLARSTSSFSSTSLASLSAPRTSLYSQYRTSSTALSSASSASAPSLLSRGKPLSEDEIRENLRRDRKACGEEARDKMAYEAREKEKAKLADAAMEKTFSHLFSHNKQLSLPSTETKKLSMTSSEKITVAPFRGSLPKANLTSSKISAIVHYLPGQSQIDSARSHTNSSAIIPSTTQSYAAQLARMSNSNLSLNSISNSQGENKSNGSNGDTLTSGPSPVKASRIFSEEERIAFQQRDQAIQCLVQRRQKAQEEAGKMEKTEVNSATSNTAQPTTSTTVTAISSKNNGTNIPSNSTPRAASFLRKAIAQRSIPRKDDDLLSGDSIPFNLKQLTPVRGIISNDDGLSSTVSNQNLPKTTMAATVSSTTTARSAFSTMFGSFGGNTQAETQALLEAETPHSDLIKNHEASRLRANLELLSEQERMENAADLMTETTAVTVFICDIRECPRSGKAMRANGTGFKQCKDSGHRLTKKIRQEYTFRCEKCKAVASSTSSSFPHHPCRCPTGVLPSWTKIARAAAYRKDVKLDREELVIRFDDTHGRRTADFDRDQEDE